LKALAAGLLSALLAGCPSTGESSGAKVDIAPGVVLRLPETQPFGEDANAIQLVQAVYRDRTETFQAVISSDRSGMTLVMTLPNGPRIMSCEWRAGRVTSKFESIAPQGLSAEHMLADIMTIYAPPRVLEAALDGGAIVVKPDGAREILRDGEPVVRVTHPSGSSKNPWQGRSRLENLVFGYRLDIKSQLLPQ
jgi:hypothetical protein